MELLAPAGNLEKLKWADAYGADAVYFGTEFGSLRSFAGNFTFDDAAEGLNILHSNGKKGYVTLNIYPFSDEYEQMIQTAGILDDMGVDAFIVSDLGLLTLLNKRGLKAALHISTQANTLSYQTALSYRELGASRVNLARELSAEQIFQIQKQTRGRIEIEVFIAGSVCFSYSGRCAISDYLTGFRANRGECKHPCRWKYAVVEETRPGEVFPVFEDKRGAYLFNSREMALFEWVPELAKAGVDAVKIEGRMKSVHYIATVVSFYRQILNGKTFSWEAGIRQLSRIPNRGYSTGFMKGGIRSDDYQRDTNASQFDSVFVGNVKTEKINGKSVVEVKNKIAAGETLEMLSPGGGIGSFTLPAPLKLIDGRNVDIANNPQTVLVDRDLEPYTILRRILLKQTRTAAGNSG